MVFSSAFFLFIFLPVTCLFYFLLPGIRAKNAVLIVASLFFYAFGEPVYILLVLASIITNYFLAIMIADRPGKLFVVLSVIFNIGLLVIFKYSALLVTTFNQLTHMSVPVPQISLPIGISFYTFQALSYCVDVYRDREMVQRKLSALTIYIAFFPQLIAGPIVKYHDIESMLYNRTHTVDEISSGIARFIFGLSKKLLIANVCAKIVDTLYETPLQSSLCAWAFVVLYFLQLYYDFSGYSDMAIGLGHIFGFTIMENFNYPYISQSMQELWRRWHISLSGWFREYLYFPLGGSRKGKYRKYLNGFIVFLCTGIWHGANWNFLLWGVFNGLFITLESAGIIRIKNRVLSHIYTILVFLIGLVIFRSDTASRAGSILKAMFTGFELRPQEFGTLMLFITPYSLIVIALGFLFCTPVAVGLIKKPIPKYGLSALLFVLCLMCLATSSYNPFIYFRF